MSPHKNPGAQSATTSPPTTGRDRSLWQYYANRFRQELIHSYRRVQRLLMDMRGRLRNTAGLWASQGLRSPFFLSRWRRRGALARSVAWGLSAALMATMLSQSLVALAQIPVPLGGEFQVNTYTTSDQTKPDVAMDANGNFVVVWDSNGSSGSDTSGPSIQGQRYDSNGNSVGSQFQVNSYTTNSQFDPAVAMDTNGNFVVVWESWGSSGSDTSGFSIQGQRYASNGNPLGSQFQINTYTPGNQTDPAVAIDANSNFVVTWESAGSSGTDTDGDSIQGQRYDSNGATVGGEFQVNTYTSSDQADPTVAMDADGDFVVAWESNGSSGSDTNGNSVQGQRYDSTGATVGGEFQINTYTTDNQTDPKVAMDTDGNFVVAWESNGSSGTDTDGDSIQGQRYDNTGSTVGGEFQVNLYTTNDQSNPAVAMDADGDFVVAWESRNQDQNDGKGAFAQRYDQSGTRQGGELQVNTYVTSNQQAVSVVAKDAGGDFVVTWQSAGSSGTDTDGDSIQGQRFIEGKATYLPTILKDGA